MHDLQPRHRSQLFAVEAREWRAYPDSTSSALRIGDLRSVAGPEPAYSVAQYAIRNGEIGLSGSSVSQNLICEGTSRSEGRSMTVAFNHLESIEVRT